MGKADSRPIHYPQLLFRLSCGPEMVVRCFEASRHPWNLVDLGGMYLWWYPLVVLLVPVYLWYLWRYPSIQPVPVAFGRCLLYIPAE